MPSVERELVVVADEGDAVAQGVGYDDMVTRVVVLLCLVDFKAGVALVVLLGVPDEDVRVNEIPLHTVASSRG